MILQEILLTSHSLSPFDENRKNDINVNNNGDTDDALPPPLLHRDLYYCHRCNRQDHHQPITNHTDYCKTNKVDLLVLVKSRVDGFMRRRIIRDTWAGESVIPARATGLPTDWSMAVLFLTGKSDQLSQNQAVLSENEVHQVSCMECVCLARASSAKVGCFI